MAGLGRMVPAAIAYRLQFGSSVNGTRKLLRKSCDIATVLLSMLVMYGMDGVSLHL